MIPIDSRANSKQPSSLERKPRPVNYRSMESLPSQPKDKENNNSFNNEYNDYNMPNDRYKKPFTYQPKNLNDEFPSQPNPYAKTTLSSDSKDSLNPNFIPNSKKSVDWAQTPIYTEY